MRLIDADDVENHIVGSVNLSGCPTINAIPIPENATNGDVIKAMFPNLKISEPPTRIGVKEISTYVQTDWWNAKFEGVSE